LRGKTRERTCRCAKALKEPYLAGPASGVGAILRRMGLFLLPLSIAAKSLFSRTCGRIAGTV
jgi:hypothetical protein